MKLADLTDEILVKSLVGYTCLACGKKKRNRQTLCTDCYRELPWAMRKAVWKGVGNGYQEAVLAALRFLHVNDAHLAPPRAKGQVARPEPALFPDVPEKSRWPRLSKTLKGPRDFTHCSSCGCMGWPFRVEFPEHRDGGRVKLESYVGSAPPSDVEELHIWREHDDKDAPQNIYVMLCEQCEVVLIEKHPRLYSLVSPMEPLGGIMAACFACQFGGDLRCGNPESRAMGGAGVRLLPGDHTTMHVRRARGGGVITLFHEPSGCEGRRVKE